MHRLRPHRDLTEAFEVTEAHRLTSPLVIGETTYKESESTEAVPAVLDQDLVRTAEQYEADGYTCLAYCPPAV